MFYFYFFNGLNPFVNSKKSKKKVDYTILDKLERLPFSDEVKKEVRFRIYLQRKYRYDARGELHPLDRFVREISDFIISSKNLEDFNLLCSIKDHQIDHNFLFDQSIKRGALKQLKYLQQKVIYTNEEMMQKALLQAFKYRSKDIVLHLLRQKVIIDRKTKREIASIIVQDEYEVFKRELLKEGNINTLYLPHKKGSLHKAKKSLKTMVCDISTIISPNENKIVSINNALVVLEQNSIIDDFAIKATKDEIYIAVWNYKSIYPIDFMHLLNKKLEFYGLDYDMHYLDKESKEMVRFLINEDSINTISSCENIFIDVM